MNKEQTHVLQIFESQDLVRAKACERHARTCFTRYCTEDMKTLACKEGENENEKKEKTRNTSMFV